jgi:flagellin
MSRINTNVTSLVSRINLSKANGDLQVSLNRLSTGLRINTGKDDPAGLIASESLRSDIVSINRAISNTQQADGLVATTEGALSQISKLLNDIRGLVTESANTGALSSEQIAANQLQVDASLEAIDRIAGSTSFQGKKLLDGSLGFITSSVSATDISALDVQQATLPSSGSLALTINVTTAAAKATVTGSNANLAGAVVVEIKGSKGAEVFTFGTGTTAAAIVSAVSLVSNAIGVDAATNGAGAYVFTSQEYGADAVVEVTAISGTFTGAGTRATGTDVAGNVNGAVVAGKGLSISLNTSTLDLQASLTTTFGTTVGSTSFNITGGGAQFQLGPDVLSNQQSRIGLQSFNSAGLGDAISGVQRRLYELKSGQAADLDSDTSTAFQIVDKVISKVATLRGRLGAFQRTTLDTNIASLNDTLTNITEAESKIRDADFAEETARLTRSQILVQSGTAVLSIANQSPQQALALLPRG